jgi:hypothetical protein
VDRPAPEEAGAPPDGRFAPSHKVGSEDGPEKVSSVPGVIRLLEAGHFKGVADVRLRLNFFDELAERAADTRRVVVEEQTEILTTGVAERIDELVDTVDIDDEARVSLQVLVDDFNASVATAVDEGHGRVSFDFDAVVDSIRLAFDTLSESIRLLVAPPDLHQGAEEEPPAEVRIDAKRTGASVTDDPRISDGDAADEPATATMEEALPALLDAFEEALAAFVASIDEATRVPDPTPPRGRGAAFEKFLAIYNDLRDEPQFDERA